MNRTSTFKMTIWLIIFLGSALSVKTLRRNTNATRQFTNVARKVSVEAAHISQITRTLLLP